MSLGILREDYEREEPVLPYLSYREWFVGVPMSGMHRVGYELHSDVLCSGSEAVSYSCTLDTSSHRVALRRIRCTSNDSRHYLECLLGLMHMILCISRFSNLSLDNCTGGFLTRACRDIQQVLSGV